MKFEKNEWWKVLVIILIACSLFYIAFGVSSKTKEEGIEEEVLIMIERHEGKKYSVYDDSLFIPTIGIGFNLNNLDNRNRIESLGISYDSVISGKTSLTDKQIYKLFRKDVKTAISNAINFLPNFDEQPNKVKIVLVDMSFNLGYNRLMQFVKFRQALIDKDYKKASIEMKDSKWYYQVGNRSKELVGMMNSI